MRLVAIDVTIQAVEPRGYRDKSMSNSEDEETAVPSAGGLEDSTTADEETRVRHLRSGLPSVCPYDMYLGSLRVAEGGLVNRILYVVTRTSLSLARFVEYLQIRSAGEDDANLDWVIV